MRRFGFKGYAAILLLFVAVLFLGAGCVQREGIVATETEYTQSSDVTQCTASDETVLEEDSAYYLAEDVALYIHTFGRLPENYVTKSEAQDLGWISEKGNLWDVADGVVIGGDRFGNREGLLPDASGRIWYECDVNYEGGYRNAYRLVYSNDGLIYYTDDHYKTFEKWYE